MNVSLGSKWEQFVDLKLKSGDYQNASEVVRAGLRMLEKQDLLKKISAYSLADLEQKLIKGIASLDDGHYFDGEEVFNKLRKKTRKRKKIKA